MTGFSTPQGGNQDKKPADKKDDKKDAAAATPAVEPAPEAIAIHPAAPEQDNAAAPVQDAPAQDTAAQDTAAQDTAAQDTAAQDTAEQDIVKHDDTAPETAEQPAEQAVTEQPAVQTAEAAPQKKWTKGLLGKVFRAATSMTLGGAFGFAVKAGIIAVTGSHAAAIIGGAVLIGGFSTGVQRTWDIYDHNKKNQDNKVGYIRDFLAFEKTGHDSKHYLRRSLFSAAFAGIGGAIGYGVADWLHGDATPAPVDTPQVDTPVTPDTGNMVTPPVDQPVVDTPVVDTPVVDQPVVDTPPVDTPVVDQPVIDQPVVDQPTVDQPVVDQPVVDQPTVDQPVVDQPVVDQPVTDPAVVAPVDPATSALDEARALLPDHADKVLAGALHRLESSNELVRAQALKDLGYFFANGFHGVTENDVMANKLYEMSLEVSGGRNTQALHDLGYQLLYGKGAAVDTVRAHELLEKAAEGGNKLSRPMLQYMDRMGLSPKP